MQGKLDPSKAVLKYPSKQVHSIVSSMVLMLLTGQGTQALSPVDRLSL